MIEWVPLIVFVGIQVLGVAIAIQWMRGRWVPLPTPHDPHYIFRLVHREDRLAYARVMRRSSAVAFRDMSRAFNQFGRTIAKELTPIVQAFADTVAGLRK